MFLQINFIYIYIYMKLMNLMKLSDISPQNQQNNNK